MIIARIQIGGLLHIQTTIKGPKFSYSKKCIAKLITYLAWGNVYLSGDLQWKGIKLDNENTLLISKQFYLQNGVRSFRYMLHLFKAFCKVLRDFSAIQWKKVIKSFKYVY